MSIGFERISNRDAACAVLPDLDYDSQLTAIRRLLERHGTFSKELQQEIAEADDWARETTGIRNYQAVEQWLDRLHSSTYQDAAHSMAAVGLLAPFIESLYHQAYLGIYRLENDRSSPRFSGDRFQGACDDAWDCHNVWANGRRRTDLVEGITQLADSIGLSEHLPIDAKTTLAAIFGYRNKMFHFGFEWPIAEREKFRKRAKDSNWPSSWFNYATSDDKVWIVYMTPSFISHCLLFIDLSIEGIGAYCKVQYMTE